MITIIEVKNYLNITYRDNDIDAKIKGILQRAEARIRNRVGISSDTKLTETEEQLVLDCCRYLFNDAAEIFEDNFMVDLETARNNRMIEAYRAEKEAEKEAEEEAEDGS